MNCVQRWAVKIMTVIYNDTQCVCHSHCRLLLFCFVLNNKADLCHFSSSPCRSNGSNKVFIFFGILQFRSQEYQSDNSRWGKWCTGNERNINYITCSIPTKPRLNVQHNDTRVHLSTQLRLWLDYFSNSLKHSLPARLQSKTPPQRTTFASS